MTPEELLKPRYKVIADYPGMKAEGLSVGQILTCRNYDNDFSEKLWCEMNDTYPHLFKLLNWWEESDIEDMPEYVEWSKSKEQEITKVVKWDIDNVGIYCIIEGSSFRNYPKECAILPATLTDYQNQSK